jgi:hypothetical protein
MLMYTEECWLGIHNLVVFNYFHSLIVTCKMRKLLRYVMVKLYFILWKWSVSHGSSWFVHMNDRMVS